jgi:hypothetical protein
VIQQQDKQILSFIRKHLRERFVHPSPSARSNEQPHASCQRKRYNFLPITNTVVWWIQITKSNLPPSLSILLIVPKSYQTQHNEGGMEKTYLFSPASSSFQNKEACLRNFHMMSFCFSMNHACVVAIIAFAAPLIGSTGEMRSL